MNAVSSDEKWPVIIHSSLQNTDIFTLLNAIHKTRVSGNIIENSVIFPKSAVAFLILAIHDIASQNDCCALDEKVVERVSMFGQVHRNCFILTTSALIEENDLAVLSALQERFFTFPMTYYPAHNHKECVSFMLHIAKVTSKPTSTLLKTRLSNLASSSTSEEVVLNILSVIGISCHGLINRVRGLYGKVLPEVFRTVCAIKTEGNTFPYRESERDCFVLHQGCHSLSNIAQASIQQLMDCSLDQETARKVYNFFHNDSTSN